MNIIKRELYEVEGDCNLDDVYNKFNELTGLQLKFEIDQNYGTGCYGIIHFSNGKWKDDYPTLKKLELKIQKYKDNTLSKYDFITEHDVVNYLRRKSILPEADLLFNVDY